MVYSLVFCSTVDPVYTAAIALQQIFPSKDSLTFEWSVTASRLCGQKTQN